MNAENKSVEAVCFAAPDGGEKAEPSVSPAQLIVRINEEIQRVREAGFTRAQRGWLINGLMRAIKIIQANEGS